MNDKRKIKFPRYSREQNLACKLTDKNILKIRQLRNSDCTYKEIAELFNVSDVSIRYWILSDAERKRRNKRQYLLWEKNIKNLENIHTRQSKYAARKYKLMPEFREYIKQFKQYEKKAIKNDKTKS